MTVPPKLDPLPTPEEIEMADSQLGSLDNEIRLLKNLVKQLTEENSEQKRARVAAQLRDVLVAVEEIERLEAERKASMRRQGDLPKATNRQH